MMVLLSHSTIAGGSDDDDDDDDRLRDGVSCSECRVSETLTHSPELAPSSNPTALVLARLPEATQA